MSATITVPASSWRAPRLRMLANGDLITGAKLVEVTSNNYYQADRANGDVSLSADAEHDLAWWDAQTDISLEVQMALPSTPSDAPAWQSIVIVTVDHWIVDLTTNCIRFYGRDLSSAFMDTKTQETFANQTSSQIAQTLASRHGMQTSIAPTSTIVGQYYQLEHDRLTLDNFSHQTTEWDLLTYLAQEEDYDVWVQGNTLYFQPQSQSTANPYQIIYSPPVNSMAFPTMNAERVTLERSLTLAKDIQVTVKSTNLRNGTAYIRVVKATGTKSAGGANSKTHNYVFTKPGMTPDQALRFGQQKLAELTKHERIMCVEMPGELTLAPRNMIQLSGTGTDFDISYYIDEIERIMDFERGFTQNIRAKNTSPRTQTTVL